MWKIVKAALFVISPNSKQAKGLLKWRDYFELYPYKQALPLNENECTIITCNTLINQTNIKLDKWNHSQKRTCCTLCLCKGWSTMRCPFGKDWGHGYCNGQKSSLRDVGLFYFLLWVYSLSDNSVNYTYRIVYLP